MAHQHIPQIMEALRVQTTLEEIEALIAHAPDSTSVQHEEVASCLYRWRVVAADVSFLSFGGKGRTILLNEASKQKSQLPSVEGILYSNSC